MHDLKNQHQSFLANVGTARDGFRWLLHEHIRHHGLMDDSYAQELQVKLFYLKMMLF